MNKVSEKILKNKEDEVWNNLKKRCYYCTKKIIKIKIFKYKPASNQLYGYPKDYRLFCCREHLIRTDMIFRMLESYQYLVREQIKVRKRVEKRERKQRFK